MSLLPIVGALPAELWGTCDLTVRLLADQLGKEVLSLLVFPFEDTLPGQKKRSPPGFD